MKCGSRPDIDGGGARYYYYYYEYLAQQGAVAASDFGMFGNEKTVTTRSRPETPDADQGALTGLPMPSHGEAHCCDPGRQMAAMKEEARL